MSEGRQHQHYYHSLPYLLTRKQMTESYLILVTGPQVMSSSWMLRTKYWQSYSLYCWQPGLLTILVKSIANTSTNTLAKCVADTNTNTAAEKYCQYRYQYFFGTTPQTSSITPTVILMLILPIALTLTLPMDVAFRIYILQSAEFLQFHVLRCGEKPRRAPRLYGFRYEQGYGLDR